MEGARFEAFGLAHILILLLTAGAPPLLVLFARGGADHRRTRGIAIFLATLLVLNFIVYFAYRVSSGYWDVRYDLPMEFCNWSTIVTVIALLGANRTMAELSYFWVMCGSIQGVITPDLQVRFPHIYFFIFFVAHSGLVVASLFVVFGMGLYPRRRAVLRTFLFTQVYFAVTFAVDIFLDTNYGYLMRKPSGPSLMDHLGPWPVYLFSMQVIGLMFVSLLYLPFYRKNRPEGMVAQ